MGQKTANLLLSKPLRQALPEAMAARVQLRFEQLYATCDLPSNPGLQGHLREYILPGLALYQLLREDGNSPEVALAQVDKTCEQLAIPSRNGMQRLGRLPFIYPALRLFIRLALRRYPAAGWQLEWVENSPHAIRFTMQRCFYYDSLSSQGAPELTASFCRMDDLIYSEVSPYLEWRRTKTIGRGAAYCDFCFARATAKRTNQVESG